MSTAPQESGQQGPVYDKVRSTLLNLNHLLNELSSHEDIPTLQDSLEQCAQEILSVINEHKEQVIKTESYLKNAIIDLTEVPYMQEEMQKIACEVALKAAIKNLEYFLESNGSI